MACCAVDKTAIELDEGANESSVPGLDAYNRWKKDFVEKGLLLQIRARQSDEVVGWGIFEESSLDTDLNRGYISSRLQGYALILAAIYDDLELFKQLYKYMKKAIEENDGHKSHGLMAKHLMGKRNTTIKPNVFEYVNFEQKRNSSEADMSVLMALFLAIRCGSKEGYAAEWADMKSEFWGQLKTYGKAIVEGGVVEQEDMPGDKYKFFAESTNTTNESKWFPSIIDFHVCEMMSKVDPAQLAWKDVITDNSKLLQKILSGTEWLVGVGPAGQDVVSTPPKELAESGKVGYSPSKLPAPCYNWSTEKKLTFNNDDFMPLKDTSFTMDGVVLLFRLSNYLSAHATDESKPEGFQDLVQLCQSMSDALGYMASQSGVKLSGGSAVKINVYTFKADHHCSSVALLALASMLSTGVISDTYDVLDKIKGLSGYPFTDKDTLRYAENGCLAMLHYVLIEKKEEWVLTDFLKGETGME